MDSTEEDITLFDDSFLRQSFDRFDDNLVENILSYLTFNEKVLFESVSKQWKRSVYSQQKTLSLTYWESEDNNSLNRMIRPIEVVDLTSGHAFYQGLHTINKIWLKSILKKCTSIETIDLQCYVDYEDLSIIGEYCPRLKSLQLQWMGLNASELDQFGKMYGHRLEHVEFHSTHTLPLFVNYLLIHCKNLVQTPRLSYLNALICEQAYFPKLESIPYYSLEKDEPGKLKNMSRFEMLCNKYSNQLKKLNIYSKWQMSAEELNLFLTNVSKFKGLKDLCLTVRADNRYNVRIKDHLLTMANNNPNLTKLCLTLNMNFLIQDHLWPVFGLFTHLVEFDISIKNSTEWRKPFKASVHSLNNLKSLKVFTIRYKQITEEFFEDIDKHLPNLSDLTIICESEITDKTITQLTGLKKLINFHLFKYRKCNQLITDESVCAVVRSCPSLRTIQFSSRPNITTKTIETLIDCMSKRPKYSLNFECGVSQTRGETEFPAINLNDFTLPANLIIDIESDQ